jgi:hypothetical protein
MLAQKYNVTFGNATISYNLTTTLELVAAREPIFI